MSFWFLLSVIGMLAMVPVHFASVNHVSLDQRYGDERGSKIGAILGMISGWGIFIFYFGIWVSPQEHFIIPLLQELQLIIPLPGLIALQIPLLHLILTLVFVLPGAWLGIKGVIDLGFETAETHRASQIITTGIYSRIRHPQYLGAVLSHIGITFLVSGLYSLLITPLVAIINWTLCWKEEKELVREYGDAYSNYQKQVPMFFPKTGRSSK